MRDIKFRAWDKIHKRMINKKENYSPLIVTNNGMFDVIPYTHTKFCFERVPDGDYELMQYTGLHDKSGREIYEGDIVGYYDYRKEFITAEIKYIETHASFLRLYKNDDGLHYSNINESFCNNCEVIGNIYENTELIS